MSKRDAHGHQKRSLLTQYMNCRILYRGELIKEDLWTRNGKIINPEKIFFDEKVKADLQIDCKNLIISPGFIDVQINGGFGYDFSSDPNNIDQALSVVSRRILEYGVTSFCPTLVTSPKHVYKQILAKVQRKPGGVDGAEILGFHLEGPFINVEKKGAHNPNHIVNGSGHNYNCCINDVYGPLNSVSIITMAPELNHAMKLIPEITKQGVVVSVGHSTADLSTSEEAAKRGATFITHLFNAMMPFHHRDPGIVGLLTSHVIPKPIYYGIIADGIHTDPTALRIAHRAHPKGLVLVTDAMAAMGLEPGDAFLGTMRVTIDKTKATIHGTQTLAGSIVTMDSCIRHLREATNCSITQALEAASLHPAELLGIESKKGSLEYNSDADFVFLSDDLEVYATMIAGKVVFLNSNMMCYSSVGKQLLDECDDDVLR